MLKANKRRERLEKPIISPSRTDAKSIISPGIVRCFVVYPTKTPCFHSVPQVRRLVAGVRGTGVRSGHFCIF